MKKANVTKVLSKANVSKIVENEELSKSSKFKQLFEGGYDVKQISKIMNVRYNFVYNVISNYIITNNVEIEKVEKITKKQNIIELFENGESLKSISITLKTNYNYVFNVIKDYKNKESK